MEKYFQYSRIRNAERIAWQGSFQWCPHHWIVHNLGFANSPLLSPHVHVYRAISTMWFCSVLLISNTFTNSLAWVSPKSWSLDKDLSISNLNGSWYQKTLVGKWEVIERDITWATGAQTFLGPSERGHEHASDSSHRGLKTLALCL